MSQTSPFSHPETGELLDSREDIQTALREIEDRLGVLYRFRRNLQTEFLKRGEQLEMPAPRWRTPIQEKVARCPRCGGRLESEEAPE